LSRALSNLISNAVRFTPDGGCITVTASASPTAVDVAVADTGIGIDAQLLEEVFEPFSAACGDPSLHTSGQFEFRARGLGLGLAITKAIVMQHGGTIAVCSHEGNGSRFTLTLPLRAADVSPTELG
jgi:signal transduction histidine kinase